MYRTIDARIMFDPKFRHLDPVSKLLFLYLIINHHSHVSGLYYISDATICDETGIDPAKLGYHIDRVSGSGLVRFDRENALIWVINMAKYQAHGSKAMKAIAYQFGTIHNSPLLNDFALKYHLKTRYPPDTLSIPHPAQDGPATQEQEQEQEQDKKQKDSVNEYIYGGDPIIKSEPVCGNTQESQTTEQAAESPTEAPKRKRGRPKKAKPATDTPAPPPPAVDGGYVADLVAAWIDAYRRRVGHDYPGSGKGKLAGTLKRLAAGMDDFTLELAIARWFDDDRGDFGIELFERRVVGGAVELVGPPGPLEMPDPPFVPAEYLAELSDDGDLSWPLDNEGQPLEPTLYPIEAYEEAAALRFKRRGQTAWGDKMAEFARVRRAARGEVAPVDTQAQEQARAEAEAADDAVYDPPPWPADDDQGGEQVAAGDSTGWEAMP